MPGIFTAEAVLSFPKPLTELVGREKDIDELLLALDWKRLITLTEIGGVGKTD